MKRERKKLRKAKKLKNGKKVLTFLTEI